MAGTGGMREGKEGRAGGPQGPADSVPRDEAHGLDSTSGFCVGLARLHTGAT